MNIQEKIVTNAAGLLCIDCKHCKIQGGEFKCRKAALKAESVCGVITYNSCENERSTIHTDNRLLCGPNGSNFIPNKGPRWLGRLITWVS